MQIILVTTFFVKMAANVRCLWMKQKVFLFAAIASLDSSESYVNTVSQDASQAKLFFLL